MAVRAKFKVTGINRGMGGCYVENEEGKKAWTPCEVQTITLHPVTGGNTENEQFFAATPGGQISLNCLNPKASAGFELDKEYYVDFTKAE